jgi:RimJ/RimL family protein N-acetyltransferase
MSAQLMAALRDGLFEEAAYELGLAIPLEWQSADWSWLKNRPEEVLADPGLVPWLPHVSIVSSAPTGRHVVGEVGFHGPPKHKEVEIGYMTISSERGRGYATEGAGALIGWAASSGVERLRASIALSNLASQAVVAKLGFEQDGRYLHPERGEEVLWRRRLSPTGAAMKPPPAAS